MLQMRMAAHNAEARALRAQMPLSARIDKVEQDVTAIRRSLRALVNHVGADIGAGSISAVGGSGTGTSAASSRGIQGQSKERGRSA